MIGRLDICFNWKKDEWQGAMRSMLVDQLRMRVLVIAIVVIGGLSASVHVVEKRAEIDPGPYVPPESSRVES